MKIQFKSQLLTDQTQFICICGSLMCGGVELFRTSPKWCSDSREFHKRLFWLITLNPCTQVSQSFEIYRFERQPHQNVEFPTTLRGHAHLKLRWPLIWCSWASAHKRSLSLAGSENQTWLSRNLILWQHNRQNFIETHKFAPDKFNQNVPMVLMM